jgi:hypothetical protein
MATMWATFRNTIWDMIQHMGTDPRPQQENVTLANYTSWDKYKPIQYINLLNASIHRNMNPEFRAAQIGSYVPVAVKRMVNRVCAT